ncbi:class I SAM-dependent methyltransferase [Alkalihalobacillus sp. NPDC078783]
MNVVVTTARKRADKLEPLARVVADELQVPYQKRKDRSVDELLEEWNADLLVVASSRLSLYRQGNKTPFFYHPNAAQVRAKAFLANGYDAFIEACDLQAGDRLLDCTLGLGADAVMAQLAVGKTGHVTGLEQSAIMAYIVRSGLQTWTDAHPILVEAMQSVEVINGHHYDVLNSLPDKSYDVVYFDPMFEQTIHSSSGIHALKSFAHYEVLSQQTIQEAMRVAKKRVVLKDHWTSSLFEELGFHVKRRRPVEFQYGIKRIELNDKIK